MEDDDSEYLKFTTFSLSDVLRDCTPLLGSSGVEFEYQDVSNLGEGFYQTSSTNLVHYPISNNNHLQTVNKECIQVYDLSEQLLLLYLLQCDDVSNQECSTGCPGARNKGNQYLCKILTVHTGKILLHFAGWGDKPATAAVQRTGSDGGECEVIDH